MVFALLKRLFKKPPKEEEATLIHDLKAISAEDWDIIGAYGEMLGKHEEEEQIRLLFPQSELPYPKQKIELALNRALKIAKDENLIVHLETVLVCLEDFIPDDEVPEHSDEHFDEHFGLWISRKNWNDPKTKMVLLNAMSRHFVKQYGDDAEQKMEEFIKDLQGMAVTK